MTSIENSLEQVRRLNERHQQLVKAITKPSNDMSRLAEMLKMPTVTVPPELFASIEASKAMANQFAAIKMPTVTVPPRLFESMEASKAMASRFAAINLQALKHDRKFANSLKRAHRLTQSVMSVCASRPTPISHRGLESAPKISVTRPIVRKLSPAQDVVTRVFEEFDRRRMLEEDRRHQVAVVITLLTGRKLHAESIATNGDLSLPFINPEDVFKRLGERIHGGARQHA